MIEVLITLLRAAGAALIILAVLHVQIGRRLRWREEAARLSPVNASIFRVHTFFICLILVMMALPCLLDPTLFVEPSRAGAWLAWSFAAFWATRLYFQWFVFPASLWKGKRIEIAVHAALTLLWVFLTILFVVCGLRQLGW